MEPIETSGPQGRNFAPTRRGILLLGTGGVLATSFVATGNSPGFAQEKLPGKGSTRPHLDRSIAALESANGVTIGIAAGRQGQTAYTYRGGDTFPMCSLFKTLAVARLLREHTYDDEFWKRRIRFRDDQIVENSIICAADEDRDMSVEELAEAALRFSDNTAGNLLLELIGGPLQIGAYARTLGAPSTRLDRWEPELNEALPGDLRDTSTPSDIHKLYEALLLGEALGTLGQARLRSWMLRNTTAGKRLGAAVPPGAELADKTGAGAYGVVNDAGVVWPDGRPPLTLAVMTKTDDPDAVNNNAVLARVGQLVFAELL
ncbi:class A beta-lactamase [Pseudarthrobacter sp. NamE5]|uniref:class A beta-lactamase n=1 Tax=Pseudarthrobacter sp. NamE5 TaxID=2576839 RepID=UPI00110B12EB|nr:class A beta-lactamase [Pseudarthrobacter sp. NamE5]TLM80856.1 class A beta-lactamase [Pseudarthrobacter sp. NamE5]